MKKPSIVSVRKGVLVGVIALIVVGIVAGLGFGTLSSLGWDQIAYLCPLGSLETLLAGGIVPRVVIATICALIIIAVLGRAFCSWVCPVPPLRRFFRPRKRGKGCEEPEGEAQAEEPVSAGCSCCSSASCGLSPVGGKRDGLRLDSRHGVLIGALASAAVFGFPVFCLVCPIGLTLAFIVGLYRAIFEQDPTISLLIFAALVLIEVVFFRKWCHKLCPMGAMMSLIGSRSRIGQPRVNAEKCLRSQGVDCHACVQSCEELLDPHSERIPECTRCGECAAACPTGAITMRPKKTLRS